MKREENRKGNYGEKEKEDGRKGHGGTNVRTGHCESRGKRREKEEVRGAGRRGKGRRKERKGEKEEEKRMRGEGEGEAGKVRGVKGNNSDGTKRISEHRPGGRVTRRRRRR